MAIEPLLLGTDLSNHTMNELIGRHWKRMTLDDEERELRAWREASERHERYYMDLIRMLDLAASTDGRERLLLEPSAADLIQLAEYRAEETAATLRPWWSRGWVAPSLAAAAGIILVLGVGEALRRSTPPEIRLGMGELVTGASATGTLTLGDGTVVRIGPGSRFRVEDAPGRRDVFLEGKAYFAVAKMDEHPFRVRTRVGDAVAVGTRFEVTAAEDLRVVVAEGQVTLGGGRDRVEVNGGEMSIVTDNSPSPPIKVDVASMLSWVGRFLAFQSTPLRRVAVELEQEYGTRVIVTDSALAKLTITGWYVDRSFEEVVTIICGVVGGRCSVHDGIATIGR